MKTAIVKSSDIKKSGRWDAEYHVLVQDLQSDISRLERQMTAGQAVLTAKTLLDSLDPQGWKDVAILAKSSASRPTPLQVETGITLAPFVGLALVERAARQVMARMDTALIGARAARADLTEKLDALDVPAATPARKFSRP